MMNSYIAYQRLGSYLRIYRLDRCHLARSLQNRLAIWTFYLIRRNYREMDVIHNGRMMKGVNGLVGWEQGLGPLTTPFTWAIDIIYFADSLLCALDIFCEWDAIMITDDSWFQKIHSMLNDHSHLHVYTSLVILLSPINNYLESFCWLETVFTFLFQHLSLLYNIV